jgi:NodT family efflux transporter outer membrane factor (OMF) lipoprotein
VPPTFNGKASPENSAQLGIKEFFNDPILTSLIDQAMASNLELKSLNEEVQVAASVIVQRRGAYLPFVGFKGGADLEKFGTFTLPGAGIHDDPYLDDRHFPNPLPDFLLSFRFLWQIDIWRELRNARDAAAERYLSALERRNYFVTRLVADIADNYYELMALDKRLENLDQIIVLQQQALDMARARLESARGTELAVQRFLAEVRKYQSEKLIVRQDIIQAENRINFLAGRFPQPVERMSARFYDQTFPLSVGVPAQLLQNRPDIRQAERELVAAGLDVKIARAHFFPRLDITGGIGYEAFNPKYLFWTPDSLIFNVAGEVVAPLINKSAIRAEYLGANAKQLESVYDYQRVILNAFTEVVNRVSKVENYGRSIAIKQLQLKSLVASVNAATQLYKNPRLGEKERVDYLDVLTAQRDLWEVKLVLIDTRRQQLSAIVNAYQALGGGDLLSHSNQGPCPPVAALPGPPVAALPGRIVALGEPASSLPTPPPAPASAAESDAAGPSLAPPGGSPYVPASTAAPAQASGTESPTP